MATYVCQSHRVTCTIGLAANGHRHHAVRIAWGGGADCVLLQAPTVAQAEAAADGAMTRLVAAGREHVLEQIERVTS